MKFHRFPFIKNIDVYNHPASHPKNSRITPSFFLVVCVGKENSVPRKGSISRKEKERKEKIWQSKGLIIINVLDCYHFSFVKRATEGGKLLNFL